MYALVTELGAVNPANYADITPADGATFIAEILRKNRPTLKTVVKDFILDVFSAANKLSSDEANGIARKDSYHTLLNDPTAWSECCKKTDANGGNRTPLTQVQIRNLARPQLWAFRTKACAWKVFRTKTVRQIQKIRVGLRRFACQKTLPAEASKRQCTCNRSSNLIQTTILMARIP